MTAIRTKVVCVAVCAALVTACGPASRVPPGPLARDDIGGSTYGFSWALEPGPDHAVADVDAAAVRDQVRRSLDLIPPDRDDLFSLAIVATFPTTVEAERHVTLIRDLLEAGAKWYADPDHAADRSRLDDPARDAPMTAPESAALTAARISPGTRGVGWGGSPGRTADAAWSLGSMVFVTGLKAETDETLSEPPIHPIAHLLAAAGADVVVEGDRYGEGRILTDLSCRLDGSTPGAELRDEIGDAILTVRWLTVPPWVAEPTAPQAAARADVRRLTYAIANTSNDPELVGLLMRIASAPVSEREAITNEYIQRVAAAAASAAPGSMNPIVLEAFLHPTLDANGHQSTEQLHAAGTVLGQLPLSRGGGDYPSADDVASVAWVGATRVGTDRLEVGQLTLERASAGVPQLLAYLADHGCRDVRLHLADADNPTRR